MWFAQQKHSLAFHPSENVHENACPGPRIKSTRDTTKHIQRTANIKCCSIDSVIACQMTTRQEFDERVLFRGVVFAH